MIRSRARPGVPSGSHALPVLAVCALAACAPARVLPPTPAPSPTRAGAPVLGVAAIEPTSDVADLTEAMRHVIHPSGDIGVDTVTLSTPPSLPDAPTVPTGAAAGPVEGGAEARIERAPATPVALAGSGEEDVSVEDVPFQDPPVAPSAADEEDSDGSSDGAQGAVRTPGVESVGLAPGAATQDAILSAWERYCASADLTPEQWGIIDRTAMPPSLVARWAERCRPEK